MAYAWGASTSAAAAASASAMAHAVKASGAIVRLEPDEFKRVMSHMDDGIVVRSITGLFGKRYHYLTSFKGLFFYTKATEPITILPRLQTILAANISIP